MRGKPSPRDSIPKNGRITPADAGKTGFKLLDDFLRWDHPRGCGENMNVWFMRTDRPGSPPRMRGKLQLATGLGKTVRITPADAGKTLRLWILTATATDHPRGCGENCESSREF